ncbi:MAG: response regulator [Patescibacteria group bacterium]|jgi:DNA-binding response OmpR family regulator
MVNNDAKILIVEDDDTLLEMYNIKFKESELTVITAQDGLAALELAKKELPVVILLDVMMPKMDGFAVLTELQNDPQTKNIPVLMLSNLGQQDDVSKGKKLGAADYIVKASMTPTQVVEKVKAYLVRG